jgi:hypothetical protein
MNFLSNFPPQRGTSYFRQVSLLGENLVQWMTRQVQLDLAQYPVAVRVAGVANLTLVSGTYYSSQSLMATGLTCGALIFLNSAILTYRYCCVSPRSERLNDFFCLFFQTLCMSGINSPFATEKTSVLTQQELSELVRQTIALTIVQSYEDKDCGINAEVLEEQDVEFFIALCGLVILNLLEESQLKSEDLAKLLECSENQIQCLRNIIQEIKLEDQDLLVVIRKVLAKRIETEKAVSLLTIRNKTQFQKFFKSFDPFTLPFSQNSIFQQAFSNWKKNVVI